MRDREVIICPKLKLKKQKEKQKRDQEKRDQAIKNFYNSTTNKTAPIKVKRSAFAAIHYHTEEEQAEAATILQRNVRRCIAQAKLNNLQRIKRQNLVEGETEIKRIKEQTTKKQSRKQRNKKRTQTEKVYFEAPIDC
tara:strand:- start:6 stop:416 length:411 start_codon:yes stop_codon:yes gene_type:complete